MKRKILCILLVCCLLLFAGCREPVPPLVNTTATEPSITAVEPTAGTTETTTAATEPEETQAIEAATTPTEPQATEPTKAPTQATDPTEPSKPEQTIPKPTEPAPTEPTPTETVPPEPPTEETVPPTTEPEQTQPTEQEKVVIDVTAIEASARSYAQTLGFVIDTSLGKGNAGYYSPEYRPLSSTQEGYDAAVGITNATKNQLNSRFTTEYCDVLVSDAYGYVRYNCTVVYSHTDEMGDWYYIYAFYG